MSRCWHVSACLLTPEYLLTERDIFAGTTRALWGFTHSAWTLSLTVCVCLPPSCLPASDSVPPSFSLLLLLLSLGFAPAKHRHTPFPSNRGINTERRQEKDWPPPGAHHPCSSPGCLSDRRVCWNIHIFPLTCYSCRLKPGLGCVKRFVECQALTFARS